MQALWMGMTNQMHTFAHKVIATVALFGFALLFIYFFIIWIVFSGFKVYFEIDSLD